LVNFLFKIVKERFEYRFYDDILLAVNIVLAQMCRELVVNIENGVAVDDSAVCRGSPPAPALPPRRYRGEMDLRMVDRPPHSRQGVAARSMDSTNGESTLPHDTYANQLRKQARRYQQTRVPSFSHPRPPPEWKPPPPPSQPPGDVSASSGTSFSSDPRKSRAEEVSCLSHVSASEAGKSWIELASNSNSDVNGLEVQKSWAHPSVPVADILSADVGLSSSEVQHITANNFQSSRGNFVNSSCCGSQHISSPLVTCGHLMVDVVSGYDRYYSIGGDHPTASLSRSFSSVIPLDSRSSDMSGARRLSQPAMQLTRHGLQLAEASPRNAERSTSSTSLSIDSEHDFSVDQKAWSASSVELPAGRGHFNTTDEVNPDSESSSKDLSTSSKVEEVAQNPPEVTELSLTELKFFRRLKFPVELDCARQAEVVAGLLQRMDRDETLVSILVPSSGHCTATDFITKVLGIAETDQCSYESLPESLRLRLSARDARHAAL